MRLRSTQFVFLLLLVCSAQTREDYALHLLAGAASEHASSGPQQRHMVPAAAQPSLPATLPADLPARTTRLDAASLAAHKAPWSMRRPALASTAVSSFTGFLRA